MTKKNWLLIFVALALAGIYVFYFTNWFTPKVIRISHVNRDLGNRYRFRQSASFLGRLANLANGANPAAESPTVPVTFILQRSYKFTELKVVALDEWQTNKNCLPLWHLVASTNSVPVRLMFGYGQNIPGMKPAVPGALAQQLEPGVKYRIFVTDGSAKGQHDFQPVAKPPTQPTAPASQ